MGGVSDWKTAVHEMSGVLKIEHSYWGDWTVSTGDSADGYIRGIIKFSNISELPIEDAKVYLDLDDTGATWDAIIVNSSGTPVDEGVIDLGSIPPGKFAEKKYWWSLRHSFGPTTENFEVTFNIIPEFTIKYTKSDAFTTDKTNVKAE